MAACSEDEDETSVLVNRVRGEGNWARAEGGGGFMSRMETLAPFSRSVITVARPRPLEPPETMNVRSLICMAEELKGGNCKPVKTPDWCCVMYYYLFG